MADDWRNFGDWVREMRQERNLSLQDLAFNSDLDLGTISRLENEHTQATLLTAVRICEALGVTSEDLIDALWKGEPFRNQHKPMLYMMQFPNEAAKQEPLSEEVAETPTQARHIVLTFKGVLNLVETTQRNYQQTRRIVGDVLNVLSEAHNKQNAYFEEILTIAEREAFFNTLKDGTRRAPEFTLRDVDLLFEPPSFIYYVISYPKLPIKTIMAIFKGNGVLILEDIKFFLSESLFSLYRDKNTHLNRHLTSVLERLEEGSWDRIKLIDVLELDRQLEQQGDLLGAYWQAGMMREVVIHSTNAINGARTWPSNWSSNDIRWAEVFVLLDRWLRYYGFPDTSLIWQLITD